MADSPQPPASESAETPADDSRLAHFEASVTELEQLVEALESGDVSLEAALAKFERGVLLARECQTLLKNAELRVDQLLADDSVAPLPAAQDDDAPSA